MDLLSYAEGLRRDLAVAAAAGGEEARGVAERLVAPLDSAVRLMLLNALSDAADEITRELAPGSVHVRLRGADPMFVVTAPPAEPEPEPGPGPAGAGGGEGVPYGDEGATARINLRLPEPLKQRVEAAAAAEGQSVNAWLVKALSAAVSGGAQSHGPGSWRHGGQSFSGWVR